jgi:hypothetical protein
MKRQTSLLIAVAATTAITAAACGSNNTDDTAAANTSGSATDSVSVNNPGTDRALFDPVSNATLVLPDGWFEMAGYGTVLHVDGDEITPHFVTSSTCVVGDGLDNDLPVDHASDDGVITLDLVGPTTDYRLVPLTGSLGCETAAEETVTALDELFTTHYPFFDQRGVDWTEAVAEIRSSVEIDSDSFEQSLTSVLVELGDGHTTLDDLDIDPDIDAFGISDVATLDELEAAIGEVFDRTIARIDGATTDETGSVAWGRLDADTGYLIMVAFEGISGQDDALADRDALAAALDAAIADLAEVEHLVVDMRFNGGGYEDLAVLAAGYFVDETTPAYRKWAHAQPDPFVQTIEVEPQSAFFDGEVIVLTSPLTASAAEAFTLAMVEVADATIVGNPSFGEFSDAIDWTLPDGTELTISMENYTGLDGTNHEAIGIPLDVTVPFDQAVDTAIDHHRSGTPDS